MSAPDFDLSTLKQAIQAATEHCQPQDKRNDIQKDLEAGTLAECEKHVVDFLMKLTCEILRLIPPRYPMPQQSLRDLGFDSMMSMELRNRIETELELDISPKEFIGNSTLAQIATIVLNHLILYFVIKPEVLSPLDGDSEEWTL